jgi:hypothetical protein
MTDLEVWAFACIVLVFLSLLSYATILFKDQMIIQVKLMIWPPAILCLSGPYSEWGG